MSRKTKARRLVKLIERHVNHVNNEWSNTEAAERVTLRLLPTYETLKKETR